jgi:hypothetical protein
MCLQDGRFSVYECKRANPCEFTKKSKLLIRNRLPWGAPGIPRDASQLPFGGDVSSLLPLRSSVTPPSTRLACLKFRFVAFGSVPQLRTTDH